jgi:hypothetical protein
MAAEVVPFKLTAPPSELPRDLVVRALQQVAMPTPGQLLAAERLADELDLLCRGRPSPHDLWCAMVWALITELQRDAS